MTSKEQLAAARRFAGKKSKAQGDYFEALIEAGCDYYRDHEVADIEKTPEPMRPIKDLGGGKFIAHYTKAAQADFKGLMSNGRGIMFEAKHTDTGRMEQDRVTSDQAERLERAMKFKGIAFVLCSFGYAGFYRIPWSVWRDMKGVFGHKYVTPEEVKRFEVRIGGPGVLLFLGRLEELYGVPEKEC